MMVAGDKKLAFFTHGLEEPPEDHIPAEFEDSARRNLLSRLEYRLDLPDDPIHFVRVFFTVPGEEWRARIFQLMNRLFGRKDLPEPLLFEDLAQLEGLLLGYDRDDVEFFIANWNRTFSQP